MRRRLAVAVAAVLLALTACSGIPTSGSVTVGTTLDEESESDFEVTPLGPETDASQEEILRGFVAAFAGSRNDYEVARQFLTPQFSDEWNPRSSVSVRSAGSSDPLATIDDDSMRYSISVAGTADATGAFVEYDDAVSLTRQFDFAQVNGQWRIDKAENGIVLSSAQFHSLFRQHALYFLDPSSTRLVPDLRWFLGGSSALRIVSTLLEGPPTWLAGAVRTAFPPGTQLADPDLGINGGIATVDLSDEALSADARDRQLMQVQLTASLGNVANVNRVAISVNGTPLGIDDLGTSGPQADPAVDTRALVLRDGEFGFLTGSTVAPIEGLSEKVAVLGASAATLTGSQDAVAVLGPAGVSVAAASVDETVTLDTRVGLVPPSLDPFDYVWTATASVSAELTVYTFAGAPTTVATGLPPDNEIRSIDVSRDGARVAILAATPTGQRLIVKAIVRDSNQVGLPTALSEPVLDVALPGITAVDATWVDELSVATIGDDDGESGATLFVVGGERRSLGPLLTGATAIVGSSDERRIRALSAAGTVVSRSGNSWLDSGVAVTLIGTQQ